MMMTEWEHRDYGQPEEDWRDLVFCLLTWSRHPIRWTIARPAFGVGRKRYWAVVRRESDPLGLVYELAVALATLAGLVAGAWLLAALM